MKLYEAKNLIRDVFEHAFDKAGYTRLVINLLKDFEEKPFTYTGNIIPNAFDPYIRRMERTWAELSAQDHPVTVNLKGMDEIEEVRVIKGLDG